MYFHCISVYRRGWKPTQSCHVSFLLLRSTRQRERDAKERERKRAWEKFPLFAPHLILVVVGHKSFYFDTIAAFPAAVLLLVPFGTFSPYLEPKLFTTDPHFLNHKITKRRALMFALWTSLVKCPKVHKSLTEKKRRFPNILAWLEATQKVTWKTGK